MTKRPVLRFVLTLAIMMSSAMILFYKGGYAYSIPFTFLIVIFMYLNDRKGPHGNNYRKVITAIPILILFYWLASLNRTTPLEQKMPSLSDMKIAVVLSCISVFIAVVSTLLILKRTKGEKAHE